MINKKIFISIIIFSIFMFVTSTIKNQTRLIEKNILSYKKKISKMENDFYETQLDYFYLTSPEVISKKVSEFIDSEYESINYSSIYFSLNQFLDEKNKTTNSYLYEKQKK